MYRSKGGDVCSLLSYNGTYQVCPARSACELLLQFLAANRIYTTIQNLDYKIRFH